MAESMQGLHRTCRCAEVTKEMIGKEVILMGCVQKARDKGGEHEKQADHQPDQPAFDLFSFLRVNARMLFHSPYSTPSVRSSGNGPLPMRSREGPEANPQPAEAGK